MPERHRHPPPQLDTCHPQISLEFNSLVTLDLSKSFYEGIDHHLTKLLCLYCSKCRMEIVEMRAIMDSPDKNRPVIDNLRICTQDTKEFGHLTPRAPPHIYHGAPWS
ncbi:hypothetical protein E1301_Tti013669 [Triplophysa tibetana]|uniref:Uncharacterized protein n=1 Tax=Triplophysa tibetana TaxID=1572043 RepID=A0A5A9PKK3_9TELE|nr:hypothetical protein E1301_Tti013669 [Triplophysa tibetana]